MKKVLIVLVLLVMALAPISPAWAMEINTYTGETSWGHPLSVYFNTYRAGDVTVRIQWTPKSGATYFLTVDHLVDPNDLSSYDQWCDIGHYTPTMPPYGDWTCTIPNGKAGYWNFRFFPESGGKVVPVTYTITAETNP